MGHAAILGALLFDAPPFGQDQDWEKPGWRERWRSSLGPLAWVGLLVLTRDRHEDKHTQQLFRAPLRCRAKKRDTDNLRRPLTVE